MSEDETMRKYAEAHGCWELRLTNLTDEQLKKWRDMIEREPGYIHIERASPVCPLPCVRDEHGEIKKQTVKELVAKIHEELIELEAVIFYTCDIDEEAGESDIGSEFLRLIAEEAADLKTAITTFEEAVLINEYMRNEAQRKVNEKNRERGRL